MAEVVNDPVLEGKLESIDIVNQGEYIPGNLGNKDELLPGNDKQPRRFRRKQVRRIEVPTVRKVKVPVVTKEIVPCEIERRVVVKKAVEVVDYEEVQEQYTEYEDRKGTRQREIWKETVEYKEEVRERPVQKTRKVKRPITRIVEEPDEQIVKVQSTKIEEVQAWRIDEVTEWREVEEASYEVYDLIHEVAGSQVVGVRDLGSIDSQHVNRTKGTEIYSDEHIRAGQVDLKGIEEDKNPDNHTQAQQALYSSQSFSSADRIGDDGQKLIGDGGMGAQKRITGPAPSQAAPAPKAQASKGRRKGGRGAAAEEPDSY